MRLASEVRGGIELCPSASVANDGDRVIGTWRQDV